MRIELWLHGGTGHISDGFIRDLINGTKWVKILAQRGARTHDRWIKSPTLYRLS